MGRVDPQNYNLFLLLIGFCVVVGFSVVYLWQRENTEESKPVTEKDLMKEIEQGYYAGGMDRDEFERAKAAMQAKIAAGVASPPEKTPRRQDSTRPSPETASPDT